MAYELTTSSFVNLSNHPVASWSPVQLDAARSLGHGEPLDLPERLPLVPPEADSDHVTALAERVAQQALALGARGAHVAGEFSLTVALVRALQASGVRCFVATTLRESVEELQPDGSTRRQLVFRFIRWREYASSMP